MLLASNAFLAFVAKLPQVHEEASAEIFDGAPGS